MKIVFIEPNLKTVSGHVYEATRALFNYIKNQNEPQSFFVSHKDANNDVIKNLPGIIPGYSLSCFEGGDDEVVISNLKNLVKNHDLTKNDVIVFLTGHLREVRVTNEIVKNNLNSPQFIIQIHQYYPPFPEADMILDEDVNGKLENLKAEDWLDAIELQAKQGVDYMTIHAGILQRTLPLVEGRITGVVSRGGAILARWMLMHDKENPLYTQFEQICDIFEKYDVTFSLGDSLRPGCLHDATDAAQIEELK
ncbi:MAG: Phosphomethylpyrimidine synthase, partial [Candidatus Collierbacteria bacterium GW2011_GWB2_42_12]